MLTGNSKEKFPVTFNMNWAKIGKRLFAKMLGVTEFGRKKFRN